MKWEYKIKLMWSQLSKRSPQIVNRSWIKPNNLSAFSVHMEKYVKLGFILLEIGHKKRESEGEGERETRERER